MRTKSIQAESPNVSIWGSGLLAIDIVMRHGDTNAFEITAGGTCANVLANLAHVGWKASAKGRIGADSAGRILAAQLGLIGVDISSLTHDERVETPVIVERFGIGNPADPRHRFEWKCPKCESPVPRFRPTPITMLDIGTDPSTVPDIFFFDRPTPGNLRLARQLKNHGVVIMFEPPRLKPEERFELAVELADIVKFADSSNHPDFESWLPANSLVVVTCGSSGLRFKACGFHGISTDWVDMPAFGLSQTLDACGSGDWVTAGMLHGFFAINDMSDDVGSRLEASLIYGQALAALNCLLPGARGLARVYSHAEISDMVAIVIAKGLLALEHKIVGRSSQPGKLSDLEAVCNVCSRLAVG